MTSSSAAAPREATLNELLVKRAAILDDRADTKLSLKDKAVFQYREERRLEYYQHGGGMDEDEVAFNAQYDSEQFFFRAEAIGEGRQQRQRRPWLCRARTSLGSQGKPPLTFPQVTTRKGKHHKTLSLFSPDS